MRTPLLRTKLYIPAVRSGLVPRPRLIERLNEGLRATKAPVRELLVQAVARGPTAHSAYAGRLLAAFSAVEEKVRARVPSKLGTPLVEPLTERELEVLRLLAADLTRPEMAEVLVVSVNTGRSHIQHIYQKLAAHSRYEALARAREFNLL
jgi:LuxR family maltose regulon positive regulatory protein